MENSDFIRQTHEAYAAKLQGVLADVSDAVVEKDYEEAIALAGGLQASLGILLFIQTLQEVEEMKDVIKKKDEEDNWRN